MRQRLDQRLLSLGLAQSREQARRLILAGDVLVDGEAAVKAGELVAPEREVRLRPQAAEKRYASRGGLKLEGALRAFELDVRGRSALDIGASTGGFTDCLLRHGCRRVIALDVGYGLLDWKLRNDGRVVVRERINARHLEAGALPFRPDLVTADLSFISLEKVLPRIVELIGEVEILALVKPQFEAGRGQVGKGGVVRDPALHRQVLHRVGEALERSCGLHTLGVSRSPITGPKGNREFFLHLSTVRSGLDPTRLAEAVARATA